MRDNDYNYRLGFDAAVEAQGASVRPTALRAPNENAFVERFVQTIKQECLDHFLAFGQKHFEFLVNEFVRDYHECRPHQGLDNKVIVAGAGEAPAVTKADQVQGESRMGGMLKTYRRAA
jgi:putative transposase